MAGFTKFSRHAAPFMLASLAACATDPQNVEENESNAIAPICTREPTDIAPRRSLFVTDLNVLENPMVDMSMRRVLTQLSAQAGTGDAISLFRQFWDTQNPGPGLGLGPHCTDDGNTENGFPYGCRPVEGSQANDATGVLLDQYFPIAAVNRFDLADPAGAHCGEYRLIYSKGNPSTFNRALVIFEAVLPNPNPGCGLAACAPVQRLWASLTRIADPDERARRLEELYFTGLPGFAPVVHIDHFRSSADGTYGNSRSGQVRTNTFMANPWMLKEFRLVHNCSNTDPAETEPAAPVGGEAVPVPVPLCTLFFDPISVKNNPFGGMFDNNDPTEPGPAFRDDFLRHIGALGSGSLNGIHFDALENVFNAGESPNHTGGTGINNYINEFLAGGGSGSQFGQNIQETLSELNLPLTPNQIVRRATTQSCAGCHHASNNVALGGGLVWPSSLTFVHVEEQFTEQGPDGPRWPISPALTNVFLPERESIMEAFLISTRCTTCGKIDPPFSAEAAAAEAANPGSVRSLSGKTVH